MNPVVLDVLRLRSAATRITTGKLLNALARVSNDGRLRDMYNYHGAGPGRFTSAGAQTQNLPRGVEGLGVVGLIDGGLTWEALKAAANDGGCQVSDVLSSLIRPSFTASPGNKLLVADYNAIEPRVLAWIADEQNLLGVFQRGDDPYKDIASKLYGKDIQDISDWERFVGKQLIIGCGYQVSAAKFELMLQHFGVDLEALKDSGISSELCVETYRQSFPAIAGTLAGVYNDRPYRRGGIWHLLGHAVIAAVEDGYMSHVGKCLIARNDKHLTITLPSGRSITYRNARIEYMRCRVAGVPVGEPKATVVYDHPRGYTSILFGGKVAENIVQGIARDLLCDAMVKCEPAGIPVVLHTHDEIVGDSLRWGADRELKKLESIMETGPDWAEGLPIKVKGYTTERYVKL